MVSAEREPMTGVLGQSPQRAQGAEPLVGMPGALKLFAFVYVDLPVCKMITILARPIH